MTASVIPISVIWMISLSPTMFGYSTCIATYFVSMIEERYPEWVITPWISFTGVNAPESYIYAIGGTVTSISGAIVNYIYISFIMTNPDLTMQSKLKSVYIKYPLIYNCFIASIAVCIQSWINLSNQFLLEFFSPKFQTMQWIPDWSSIIHVWCALIFFGSVFWHQCLILFTFNIQTKNRYLIWSYYYKLFIVIIEFIVGNIFFWDMVFMCYVIDPFDQYELFHFGVNLIGFCQWIAVGSFCLFWISYAWDCQIIFNPKGKVKAK